MNIHIPTIVTLITISSGLNIAIFLVQYFINKKFKGVISWIIAFTLIATAQLISLIHINYQLLIANAIAGLFLTTGFILIAVGLQQFLVIKVKVKLLASIFSIAFISAIAFYFHKYEIIEEAISFICLGTVSFIISNDLFKKHRTQKNYSLLFIAIFFILYFLLFISQSIVDIVHINKPYQTNYALLPFIYVLSFIMCTLSAFSFVMLLNQQLVFERQKTADRLQISETNYRNDFLFLQSILDSPQGIIIFSLDANYCYTAFTSFHKIIMKNIWGAEIYKGQNIFNIISNTNDKAKAKKNFDRGLSGESFVEEEAYGDEKLNRSYFENRYSPIINEAGTTSGVSVFVIDISKRKNAEEALQEEKNHFETLFKISPDAALVSSIPEGKIIDINDAFENISGYGRQEAINHTIVELGFWANPSDRNKFLEAILTKGFCKNLEVTFFVKNGSKKTILLSSKTYSVGGVPHLISIMHDISMRKMTEEALYLTKYAISHTSDAVFWVKEDGRFFEINEAACSILGYNKEELIKLGVMDIDPNFDSKIWNSHWVILKEKKHLTIVSSLLKKDGNILETEVNTNYINFNGIELNCAFVRDISERKREEEEKEKTRLNYEALINSTADLMWSVDKSFNLITGNKAFTNEMTAFMGQPILQNTTVLMKDIFDIGILQNWQKLYESAFLGITTQQEINVANPNNNGMRWIDININPIYNGDKITGVACYGKNITTRKQQENTVIELNRQIKLRADELASSNKELEEFAYIASHDLQEPLRMVSSFLKLLHKKYDTVLDEKGRQYIYFAVDGATRMRQIILDLLEYSRVGKGKQQPELINLHQLLNDILLLNSVAIKEKNAIIKWNNLPEIHGIKVSIQQVFQNLISNALKYQQPGNDAFIEIIATEAEEHWLFEVADNGIGIDPAFYDKIFVVFQRLHEKDKYEGNGIGLSVCKKIIEKDGGKIWVESNQGKGCRFLFTLKK